jgi:hypothetical protein
MAQKGCAVGLVSCLRWIEQIQLEREPQICVKRWRGLPMRRIMKASNCLFRQADRGIRECSHLKTLYKLGTELKIVQVNRFLEPEVLNIARRKPSRSPRECSVMRLRIFVRVHSSA